MRVYKNFINNDWVGAISGKTFPEDNPATEEVFSEVLVPVPEILMRLSLQQIRRSTAGASQTPGADGRFLEK